MATRPPLRGSGDWDELADWWLVEVDDPAYREEVIPLFLEVLGPVRGKILLDLGCGDGRIQDLLAARDARAIGVDTNLELAGIAARGHPVFIHRLPDLGCVSDAAVDGAYVVLALEHFASARRFFAETARVTRAGGSLVIVINHPLYTAPGSGPVIDPTDGELFWRFGDYLSEGRTREPAGDRAVEFIHRPIGTLLTQAATAGWSLEKVLEHGVGPRAAARDPILAKHGDIPHLMALRWLRA
ncbi:MAG: class I SAM-dependent methyltransferase [bacterium]|nr:class I SAM-dependent methyltransferase [bacterium]MDE0353033.1 class I SAM-dependent methyltransferase [bacterium]